MRRLFCVLCADSPRKILTLWQMSECRSKRDTEADFYIKVEFSRAMRVSRIATRIAKIPLQAATCAALAQSANFTIFPSIPFHLVLPRLSQHQPRITRSVPLTGGSSSPAQVSFHNLCGSPMCVVPLPLGAIYLYYTIQPMRAEGTALYT